MTQVIFNAGYTGVSEPGTVFFWWEISQCSLNGYIPGLASMGLNSNPDSAWNQFLAGRPGSHEHLSALISTCKMEMIKPLSDETFSKKPST